jgi:hypothetical protein
MSLAVVLQRSKDLRTLEIGRLASNVTADQLTPLANSFGNITRFSGSSLYEEHLALLLHGLRSVQELALSCVICTSPTPLSAVTQLCGQLTSLTLTQWRVAVTSAEEVSAMCQELTRVEQLCLHLPVFAGNWITNELLSTIGSYCSCLRSVSIATYPSHIRKAYTMGGVTTLLRGCPALQEVDLQGSAALAPQMRALRPDVTFQTESSRHPLQLPF